MNDAKAVGVDRGEMLTPVNDRDMRPLLASRAARSPPIAPAPTTAIFMRSLSRESIGERSDPVDDHADGAARLH